MTVQMHVTLEVKAAGMAQFCDVMREIVPIVEKAGWKLRGAFVQSTGRLNTVIDIWDLDDYDHLDRGIAAIVSHADGQRILGILADSVSSETIVFAKPAPYFT